MAAATITANRALLMIPGNSQARRDLAAAQRLEIDGEHHRTPEPEFLISGEVLEIVDLEVEAVAIIGEADGVAQNAIVLEVVAHRPEEAPSACEVPACIAPNLLFVKGPTGGRLRVEIRIID